MIIIKLQWRSFCIKPILNSPQTEVGTLPVGGASGSCRDMTDSLSTTVPQSMRPHNNLQLSHTPSRSWRWLPQNVTKLSPCCGVCVGTIEIRKIIFKWHSFYWNLPSKFNWLEISYTVYISRMPLSTQGMIWVPHWGK